MISQHGAKRSGVPGGASLLRPGNNVQVLSAMRYRPADAGVVAVADRCKCSTCHSNVTIRKEHEGCMHRIGWKRGPRINAPHSAKKGDVHLAAVLMPIPRPICGYSNVILYNSPIETMMFKGPTIQERSFTLLEIDCPGNAVWENVSAAYQGVVHHLLGREVEKLSPGPDSNWGPPTSQATMLPLSHRELAFCWVKFGS